MPSYSKNEVILVRYPFSALSGVKVRPAIIVNAPHVSQDVFIVPLTSRTTSLLAGEFILTDWAAAGLHSIREETADADTSGITPRHRSA
jgi:mRNA interferase MazF